MRQDAWPLVVGGDGIRRYNILFSPLYQNPGEEALSAAAVVNDVVFVATNRPALYGFDVTSGVLKWWASDLTMSPSGSHVRDVVNMGAGVSGDYVVLGDNDGVLHIYWLLPIWHFHIPPNIWTIPLPIVIPDPAPFLDTGELIAILAARLAETEYTSPPAAFPLGNAAGVRLPFLPRFVIGTRAGETLAVQGDGCRFCRNSRFGARMVAGGLGGW